MQQALTKRTFIRITLTIIALAAVIVVVIGGLARRAAGRKLRETILAELQPVSSRIAPLSASAALMMADIDVPESD